MSILPLVIHLPSHQVRVSSCHWQLVRVKSKRLVGGSMNVLLLYRAALISIDGRILTEGSRVDCQSRTSRRRGRISPWQGNRELHLIPSWRSWHLPKGVIMLTKGSSARGSRPLNPGLHLSRGHLKCPRIGQKWRMHLKKSN